MNQGTYTLAASMVNQINRLDQITNNLANVNTNGFKQEGMTETSFNNYLKKSIDENFVPSKINLVTNTIPKLDSKYINGSMGNLMPTNNELDFALKDPDAFFKVLNNESGEIEYTRDGAFKILDGFLVDSSGNQILNPDNTPIVATDEDMISQIGIVKIPYTNLDKVGDNKFQIKDLNNREIFENNDGVLVQGMIERSNVNSITAMVSLIDAQRRFEQSQKAVSTIDELNGKLIDKVGNNTR